MRSRKKASICREKKESTSRQTESTFHRQLSLTKQKNKKNVRHQVEVRHFILLSEIIELSLDELTFLLDSSSFNSYYKNFNIAHVNAYHECFIKLPILC